MEKKEEQGRTVLPVPWAGRTLLAALACGLRSQRL